MTFELAYRAPNPDYTGQKPEAYILTNGKGWYLEIYPKAMKQILKLLKELE